MLYRRFSVIIHRVNTSRIGTFITIKQYAQTTVTVTQYAISTTKSTSKLYLQGGPVEFLFMFNRLKIKLLLKCSGALFVLMKYCHHHCHYYKKICTVFFVIFIEAR